MELLPEPGCSRDRAPETGVPVLDGPQVALLLPRGVR
jgi:hypothetical protein